MPTKAELLRIMCEAVIRTAECPAELRGPWVFDEAELQENARHARAIISQADEVEA